MPSEVDKAHRLTQLENEVSVCRSRVKYLTRNLDESVGTSLQGTPEYDSVITALTEYAKRVMTEMPPERR